MMNELRDEILKEIPERNFWRYLRRSHEKISVPVSEIDPEKLSAVAPGGITDRNTKKNPRDISKHSF